MPQPKLPELGSDKEGNPLEWSEHTKRWWEKWGESELSNDFTETDWDYLLDTALMHHLMWGKGQWTLAAEVRLRVAKFGATPEDRARLRITFETADEVEDKGTRRRAAAGAKQPTRAADPRSILHVVPDPASAAPKPKRAPARAKKTTSTRRKAPAKGPQLVAAS